MMKKIKNILIFGRKNPFLDALIHKLTAPGCIVLNAGNVNDVFNKSSLRPFDVIVADLDSFDEKGDRILNYFRIFQSKVSIITIIPTLNRGQNGPGVPRAGG